jgi:hypothetical protein
MTTEAPDTLSTLVAAKQLYEEAHHIWFKAMDTVRWGNPPADAEKIAAAYQTTYEAIGKYARAMQYMIDLIHVEQEKAAAGRASSGGPNG